MYDVRTTALLIDTRSCHTHSFTLTLSLFLCVCVCQTEFFFHILLFLGFISVNISERLYLRIYDLYLNIFVGVNKIDFSCFPCDKDETTTNKQMISIQFNWFPIHYQIFEQKQTEQIKIANHKIEN